MNTLQAIIFDKDGVIVNSEQVKCVTMEQALASLGVTNLPNFDEWFFSRVGVPGLESCERCVARYGLALEPQKLHETTEKARREAFAAQDVPIIESTVEFMKRVYKYGLKIGIATSDAPQNMRKHMQQAGVLDYIAAMTSGAPEAGEVTRDKPHPDVYLVAAKKLGLEPRACAAIEDTAVGVKSAKAAGMYCIAFKNPLSGNQDYSLADMVTADLRTIDLQKLTASC
jgi:beta-phosphoglucomutase-like phosphatase (HAD superfamily)